MISPLISLMDDQIDGLTSRGVSAAAVHSNKPREENLRALDGVLRGEYALLYMSPEFVISSESWVRSAGGSGKVSLVAIDESHCTVRDEPVQKIIEGKNLVKTFPRCPPLFCCRCPGRALCAGVSEWGPDFRKDYCELWRLKEWLAGVPVVALTATASDPVKRDIVTNLKVRAPAPRVGLLASAGVLHSATCVRTGA